MPFPDRLTGWRDTPPPPQASRVYYSYRLLARSGFNTGTGNNWSVVGTFQTFNPTAQRTVTRVRGIANNSGYPFELVPGPSDTKIQVSYLALYLLPLNEALGYNIGSIIDLNRQRVPFDIEEQCVFPLLDEATSGTAGSSFGNINGIPVANHLSSQIETNFYYECYLSAIGRTIAQGTVTIAETATIEVTGVTTDPVKKYGGITTNQVPSYTSLGAAAGTFPN